MILLTSASHLGRQVVDWLYTQYIVWVRADSAVYYLLVYATSVCMSAEIMEVHFEPACI